MRQADLGDLGPYRGFHHRRDPVARSIGGGAWMHERCGACRFAAGEGRGGQLEFVVAIHRAFGSVLGNRKTSLLELEHVLKIRHPSSPESGTRRNPWRDRN